MTTTKTLRSVFSWRTADNEAFRAVPSVTGISFGDNRLQVITRKMFSGLVNLETLWLHQNLIHTVQACQSSLFCVFRCAFLCRDSSNYYRCKRGAVLFFSGLSFSTVFDRGTYKLSIDISLFTNLKRNLVQKKYYTGPVSSWTKLLNMDYCN